MELTIITAEVSGPRVDAWLSEQVPGLTRSAAQRLLAEGQVTRDGVAVKKHEKINAGNVYTLVMNEAVDVPLVDQNIPLDLDDASFFKKLIV